jgi:hypothetical protein
MRRNIHTSEEITRKQNDLEEKRRSLIEQKYKQAQLITLDLLRADRSSLSTNQWNLISNITHIYDIFFEENKQKISHLYIFDEQRPIKMRLKISNYQQLAATYFTFIVPFLERIPDYQLLELSDRLTLIHHNMVTLTAIHGHHMTSITGFISNFDKNYGPIVNMIYGNELISENERLRQRNDSIFHTDLFLVKLLLVILAFSNVTPCLSFTSQIIPKSMNEEMMFSKRLFQIQNDYVDIMWRYMLFRYRDEKVVIRLYFNIVYNCLHLQNFFHQVAERNDLHKHMYDKLVEQIETKLNVEDEI